MLKKAAIASILLLAICAVILLSLGVFSPQGDSICERMKDVAEDGRKISYMKNWAATKLHEKEVLDKLGWNGVVRLLDDPDSASMLNIDWYYIGINKSYSFVQIHRVYKDRDDFLNPSNIKSIAFGEGRSMILVKLNNSEGFYLDWPKEEKDKLININKEVAVYCGS